MAIYSKKTIQKLPISVEQAWDFLSSPYNLKTITPEHMGFEIINGITPDDKMFAGQVIAYKISPLPGFRTEWVTEITHVKEGEYFIDEQRFGPYSFWHHRHQLKSIEGGVLMEDNVHYKIPFGILGSFMHTIFIKSQLEKIFRFREKALESKFGKYQ